MNIFSSKNSGLLKRLILALFVGVFTNILVGNFVYAAQTNVKNSATRRLTTAQSIKNVGQIREQAQRITKLYLQIGMGLSADVARKQLCNAKNQLDQSLFEFARNPNNNQTPHKLKFLSENWKEMKRLIKQPYSLVNSQTINYIADQLTIASDTLALPVGIVSDTSNGILLDLSLRQSMLIQRLARLYLIAYSGEKTSSLLAQIELTQQEFSATLNNMIEAPENSKITLESLQQVKIQWILFEHSTNALKNGRDSTPVFVTATSEKIIEALDRVSTQYVQHSKLAIRKDVSRLVLNRNLS